MEQPKFEMVEQEDGTITVIVRAANDNAADAMALNGDPEYNVG